MAVVGAVVAVVGLVIEGISASNSNRRASDAAHAAQAKQAQQNQYADKLNKLMADPSAALNDPAAKGAAQATTRQMASMGYLGSGNMAAAIQQSNLGYIQSQENFLANAAGLSEPLNPLLNTAASSQAYAQQQQMQLMSNAGYGIKKAADYFSTPGSSSGGIPGWGTSQMNMPTNYDSMDNNYINNMNDVIGTDNSNPDMGGFDFNSPPPTVDYSGLA